MGPAKAEDTKVAKGVTRLPLLALLLPLALGSDPCSDKLAWSIYEPGTDPADRSCRVPPAAGDVFKVQCEGTGGTLDGLARAFNDCPDAADGITELSFSNNTVLSGTLSQRLPQSLTKLMGFLTNLSGTLPAAFAALSSLAAVSLRDTKLSGTFPAVQSQKVASLWFGGTKLSGTLPGATLTRLNSSLVGLSVRGTKLSGTLPIEISQLTSLGSLLVDGVRFNGTVPSLHTLDKLEKLQIADTGFHEPPCPPGSSTEPTVAPSTACVEGPSGQRPETTTSTSTSACPTDICWACPPGRFAGAAGQTQCTPQSRQCGPGYGYYDDEQTFRCPPDFSLSTSGNICYKVLTSTASWEAQETACENHGSGVHLAEVPSQVDQDFIENTLLTADSGGYFIGVNDKGREGQYRTATGGSVSFFDWAPSPYPQPDNGFGNYEEDCAKIMTGIEWGLKWNDAVCSKPNKAICSRPSGPMMVGAQSATMDTCRACGAGQFSNTTDANPCSRHSTTTCPRPEQQRLLPGSSTADNASCVDVEKDDIKDSDTNEAPPPSSPPPPPARDTTVSTAVGATVTISAGLALANAVVEGTLSGPAFDFGVFKIQELVLLANLAPRCGTFARSMRHAEWINFQLPPPGFHGSPAEVAASQLANSCAGQRPTRRRLSNPTSATNHNTLPSSNSSSDYDDNTSSFSITTEEGKNASGMCHTSEAKSFPKVQIEAIAGSAFAGVAFALFITFLVIIVTHAGVLFVVTRNRRCVRRCRSASKGQQLPPFIMFPRIELALMRLGLKGVVFTSVRTLGTAQSASSWAIAAGCAVVLYPLPYLGYAGLKVKAHVQRHAIYDAKVGKWKDKVAGSNFVSRYGPLFESFRPNRFYWRMVHLLTSTVSGAILGLGDVFMDQPASCIVPFAILHFSYAIAVAVFRPYIKPLSTAVDVTIHFLYAVMALLPLHSPADPAAGDCTRIETTLLVLAILVLVLLATRSAGRRLVLLVASIFGQSSRRRAAAKQGGSNKGSSGSGRGGGGGDPSRCVKVEMTRGGSTAARGSDDLDLPADGGWQTYTCHESGRRYLHHAESGHSKWVDDDDEGDSTEQEAAAGAAGQRSTSTVLTNPFFDPSSRLQHTDSRLV